MNNSPKDYLRQIKFFSGAKGPQIGLKVIGYNHFFLRPIPSKPDLISNQDIQVLTEWRNLYPSAFLTEFIADEARTFRWLSQVVYPDDGRILFMLEDEFGQRIGYMGAAFIDWEKSYVEPDAIVSGGNAPKGLMQASLITLILWLRGQMGLCNIGLRVLSDNSALFFYRKIGFKETKRVPLKCVPLDQCRCWTEDEFLIKFERELVYHLWQPENSLLEKYLK